MPGVGVMRGIVYRFLRDTIEVVRHRLLPNGNQVLALQRAIYLETGLHPGDQLFESRREAFPFEQRREQSARQLARLADGGIDQTRNPIGRFHLKRAGPAELGAQVLAVKKDSHQKLAELVVQIMTDARLFAVADL